MPIINLGPFGRFQINRHKIDGGTEHHLISNTSDDPSPYDSACAQRPVTPALPSDFDIAAPTETPSPWNKSAEGLQDREPDRSNQETANKMSWHSSNKASRSRCKVRQLRRYLIEIVALTLDADFNLLNKAMYGERAQGKATSILSPLERAELFALSSLAWKANRQHAQKHDISDIDQQRLRNEILEPACDIGVPLLMSLDTLDLIAWYSEPLMRPIPWAETIPGYWKHSRKGAYNVTRSMRYFRDVLEYISMTEKIGAVLQQAFDKCYRREGYGELGIDKTFFPPRRQGFHRLYFDVFHQNKYLEQLLICRLRRKGGWYDCACESGTSEPADVRDSGADTLSTS
jgi:hypothetical protein